MKITTLLFTFLFPLFSFCLHHKTETSLFNHMVEVNENWTIQDESKFSEIVSFSSDIERIQTHLLLVEKTLRAKSTNDLNKNQSPNRQKMLEVLHSYALRKVFPINTDHSVRQPYFIDKFGTHCAVGFLVKESGFGWISKEISETQNYAYVREILLPELVKWSVDYGFSLEELAWIQPSYTPLQSYSQLGEGANGKVTESVAWGSSWYFSGEFDTLDNLPCMKIGKYQNGQLSCLGNGLDGEVNHLTVLNGVQATGHFLDSGVYYPMATFQNNVWSFHSIPNRLNARATAFGASSSLNYIIAIDHLTLPNEQEIWKHSNGNWEQIAKVHGVVYDISGHDGSFVGKFDSVEVYLNGAWSTVVSKNVIIRQNSGEYEGIIGVVPDTVYTISQNWYVRYLGGSATNDSTSSGVIVSSVFNGVAQPLLTTTSLASSNLYAIYKINVFEDDIIISGKFQMQYGTYITQNIGKLFPASGTVETLGMMDYAVYTFGLVGGTFCIGGAFNTSYSGGSSGFLAQDVNRLGKLDGFLSLSESHDHQFKNVILFPNPSKGKLEITGILPSQLVSIQIYNTLGKLVLTSDKLSVDGSKLQAGIYLVKITLSNGQSTQKRWMRE